MQEEGWYVTANVLAACAEALDGKAFEQDSMSKERIALLICAAHCQGGHGDAGRAAAEALGISFPITMKKLEMCARKDGFDPKKLWPWYPMNDPTPPNEGEADG